jgi:predicted dehydrogenase
VQVGFENRSAPYAVTARQYIASGKLGRVQLIKVYNMLPGPHELKLQPETQPPSGLDWDRFLGPAPERPYSYSRLRNWGEFWDYGGGTLSGDASHQFDLIRLVLGDPAAPRAVSTSGGRWATHDTAEVPDTQIVTFEYPEMVMTCENTTFTPFMVKSNAEERMGSKWPFWPQNGERIEIYGTKQMMYLGRHGMGWQVLESGGKIVAQEKGYFPDKWHQPNFIDCMRSRKTPNADIELAHQSAILVHMGNISYRCRLQEATLRLHAGAIHRERRGKPFSKADLSQELSHSGYRLTVQPNPVRPSASGGSPPDERSGQR